MENVEKDIHQAENQTLQNTSFYQKRWFKWLASLVVIFLFITFGFVQLTEYLAGRILKSQVSDQTNNTYVLDYSDLKIKWVSKSIVLVDANYHKLDNSESDTITNDYSFTANQILIELESISDIYFEKTVHVTLAQIIDPHLEIKQNLVNQKKSSFSFETGQLYEVLQGFVSTFQIDELNVQHMHLNYFSPNKRVPFTLNDVSFTIKNFLLDSNAIASNNQFFFTESFELKVVDQTILFADSVHATHFDSLTLSTISNNIELHNVRTDTLFGSSLILEGKNINRYYSVVPYVGIIGLDFKQAYQKNILHVDSMLYNDPIFNMSLKSIVKDSNRVKVHTNVNNGLIHLILSVFTKVELDQFQFENAFLSAEYGQNEKARVDGLTLEFTKFVLDSMDLKREIYYPNFKDLLLEVNLPQFNLPNQSLLKANDLTFSTYDSTLNINEVVITHKDDKSHKTGLVGSVDKIRFTGINPRQILNKKAVYIDSFQVVNPKLQMVSKQSNSSSKKFDIRAFLSKNIHIYHANRVDIINGALTINNSKVRSVNQGIEEANISLNGFTLSENSLNQNKLLLSNSAFLSFKKIRLYNEDIQHIISLNKIKINSSRKQILVSGFNMRPLVIDSVNLKLLANVKADHFLLNGLNLNSLKSTKIIDLRNIELKNVEANIIQLKKDTSSNFDFAEAISKMEKIDMKNVEIENVNVSFQKNDSTVIKFSNGHLFAEEMSAISKHLKSGKLKFLTDSLSYGVNDIVLPLPKLKHWVTIQEVNRSVDSTLTISHAYLNPIPGVQIPDSTFKGKVHLPLIKISDFHSFDKKFTDTLDLGVVDFIKPHVDIRLPKKDTSSSSFKLLSHLAKPLFGGEIRAIAVEQFNISNGSIKIAKDSLEIGVGDVDLDSKNWFISDSTEWLRNKFLWADDFNMNLANLNYNVPGVDICHKIDSLSYHFKPNTFTIHGIYFSNETHPIDSSNSFYSLYLPDIKIIQPHIYDYLTDSILIIDKIIMERGMLEASINLIKSDSAKSESKFSFPIQVPENLAGLKKVGVNEISFTHMGTEFELRGKTNTSPLDLNEFNLRIDSFHIEPGELVDTNRILWADNIVLDVNNIRTNLDEGLYEFGADHLHLSTKEDSIGLSTISFIPVVGRYEYPLYKGGYQRDVFNIQAKSIGISELDFHTALYDQKIVGNFIKVEQPDLKVLKDKRNLAPPYKYKPTIPEIFKNLPVSITFDSILVNEMRVRYEESPKKGRNSGVISLTHMNIVARNATNDTSILLTDSLLVIEMTSKLLDTADIEFYAKYYMLTPNNKFEMTTTLGPIDGTILNQFVEPVYSAKINSLDVVSMDMSAIGNDSVSGGLMGLYYDNLKFSFLDDATKSTGG